MISSKNIASKKNLSLAFDRLLTNPESTYKSFFRDSYSAYGMVSEKNIEILNKKLLAGYIPEKTIRVFMPKANGLNRMYTLLTVEDQIVYQAYANIIAVELTNNEEIKRRYKRSVFGNLFTDSSCMFFYQQWQDSYKAYTRAIIKAYNKGLKYIASFDLTACFDSINHFLLRSILLKKCNFSENCSDTFISLLKRWESSDGLELATGIPQGPQASGIVAEAILQEYDSYIEELQKDNSFRYFRYVDDIRILSDNEDTVRWVLFLLDKKSKELGLFPQSSKITVHEISNIDDEIKRISKPLFDDEIDEEKKPDIAASAINQLVNNNTSDLTTIKRYFHNIKQDAKSNRIAIKAVEKYPNLIHSFAYYVKRYPRKIPPTIADYIYGICKEKTRQFSSGILLDSVCGNMREKDLEKFISLAGEQIKADQKKHFIIDDRYRLQLILLVLMGSKKSSKALKGYIEKCSWWVKSNLIYQAQKNRLIDKLGASFLAEYINSEKGELAISGAYCYLLSTKKIPSLINTSSYAHNLFVEAGLECKERHSDSQIPRYLQELVGFKKKFDWKKKLNKDHDHVERTIFIALGYWKTDLTAFVNMWDTIDDMLYGCIAGKHSSALGGYNKGQLGSILTNKNFIKILPNFQKLCTTIHELRLKSHLSHPIIKRTRRHTGPIAQSNRKIIPSLIKKALDEIVNYW